MDNAPNIMCQEHNEKLDQYCKNENCPIQKRIFCSICEYDNPQHKGHNTTNIKILIKETIVAAEILKSMKEQTTMQFKQITLQFDSLLKQYTCLLDKLGDIQNKTRGEILQVIKIVTSLKNQQSRSKIFKESLSIEINNTQQLKSNNEINKQRTPDTFQHFDSTQNFVNEREKQQQQNTETLQSPVKLKQNSIITQSQALTLFNKKQFKDAFIYFQQIIEQEPNNYEAYYHAGLCLSKQKKYEESFEYFDMNIVLTKNNTNAQFAKSQVLFALQDVKRFESCFQSMKEDSHPKLNFIQGQLLLLKKQPQQALDYFTAIETQDKNELDALYYKAKCLLTISGQWNILQARNILEVLKERGYDQELLNSAKT